MGQRWRKVWQLLAYTAAAVFLLWLVHWSGFERSQLTWVEKVLRETTVPFTALLERTASGTIRLLSFLGDYKQIQVENEALKTRIQELEARVVQLEEFKQENIRLRELLNYREEQAPNYKLVAAPVVGRNPGNWYRTIMLGRGSTSGLNRGQVVVTAQGVVGRIIATTPGTAEVLLLLDREGAVGGLAQKSRVVGVVEGSPDHRGYLQMIHLAHNSQVSAGETVITSGLGGVFPKGLLIGTITHILPEPDGLTKRALIRPAIDFERLEEVLVITEVKTNASSGSNAAGNPGSSAGIQPVQLPSGGGG